MKEERDTSPTPSDPCRKSYPVNPEVYRSLYTLSGLEPPTWDEFVGRIHRALEEVERRQKERLRLEAEEAVADKEIPGEEG